MSKGHSINMLRLVTSAKFLLFECGAERTIMLSGLPFIIMDWLPRKSKICFHLGGHWVSPTVLTVIELAVPVWTHAQIHKVIQCGASPHQMNWIVGGGQILIHFCIL